MTRERELEIIKKIIEDGYDRLDVISFEYDIPMHILEQIKSSVEQEKYNRANQIKRNNQNFFSKARKTM